MKVVKAMREAEKRAGAVGGAGGGRAGGREVERVLPRGRSERVARLERSIGVPRQRVGGLPPEASETKGV